MKTGITFEECAFCLQGSSYNGLSEEVIVTWDELKNSNAGKSWSASNTSSCGRDERNEDATVVYKDDRGCAVLFTANCTTDEPDPEYYEPEPELQWFRLR